MTMNSSGPISLGGSVTGQSINLEILQTATTQVSLNDSKVRTLAQVPSGPITMATNFWGKKYAANSAYYFIMGGGGTNGSGGPGGGQMLGQNTGVFASALSGTYTVTVGGAGSTSSISGIATAVAGGNGGLFSNISGCDSSNTGGNGACGGGGTIGLTPAFGCSGGSPTVSGGTAGGSGYGCCGSAASQAGAGGGGGLGGAGQSADNGVVWSGNGGAPITSTFNPTGTAVQYGGGAPGQAFTGGGAIGVYIGSPAANTGYGGYSGQVILRTSDAFPQCPTTGSPTIVHTGTAPNGYYWYTFNGSGTITF